MQSATYWCDHTPKGSSSQHIQPGAWQHHQYRPSSHWCICCNTFHDLWQKNICHTHSNISVPMLCCDLVVGWTNIALPLRTEPIRPLGVKSLVPSQEKISPSLTSISLFSARATGEKDKRNAHVNLINLRWCNTLRIRCTITVSALSVPIWESVPHKWSIHSDTHLAPGETDCVRPLHGAQSAWSWTWALNFHQHYSEVQQILIAIYRIYVCPIQDRQFWSSLVVFATQ